MTSRKQLRTENHDLRELLTLERKARHDAEVRAASAVGELSGYRRAINDVSRENAAARDDARNARTFAS